MRFRAISSSNCICYLFACILSCSNCYDGCEVEGSHENTCGNWRRRIQSRLIQRRPGARLERSRSTNSLTLAICIRCSSVLRYSSYFTRSIDTCASACLARAVSCSVSYFLFFNACSLRDNSIAVFEFLDDSSYLANFAARSRASASKLDIITRFTNRAVVRGPA